MKTPETGEVIQNKDDIGRDLGSFVLRLTKEYSEKYNDPIGDNID